MRVTRQNASGSVFANGYARTQSERQTAAETASTTTGTDNLPKAKLVRTNFGFSIGGFGLHYTSEDIEIDGGKIAQDLQAQKQKREAAAFAQEMDVASASVPPPEEDASTSAQDSPATPLTRRTGVAAYAGQKDADTPSGRTLGVV